MRFNPGDSFEMPVITVGFVVGVKKRRKGNGPFVTIGGVLGHG